MLASYPRSGNTWMRLLLSDVLLQLNGFATDTELPIVFIRIIPDIHKNDLSKIDARIKIPFRIIKTHHTYSEHRLKTIYIFRQPEDALCSYYYFHLRYDHLKKKVSEGIDKFCLDNLNNWCHHIAGYLQVKQRYKDRVFMISYEKMHQKPVDCLAGAMKFLRLDTDVDICGKAVENHTFEKQRSKEKIGKEYNENFFRVGKPGNAKSELSEHTLALLKDKSQNLYKKAVSFEEILM